jgi:hypothetical protein
MVERRWPQGSARRGVQPNKYLWFIVLGYVHDDQDCAEDCFLGKRFGVMDDASELAFMLYYIFCAFVCDLM